MSNDSSGFVGTQESIITATIYPRGTSEVFRRSKSEPYIYFNFLILSADISIWNSVK